MPTRSELRSRIALPQREQLSADGQRIYDSIMATRGNLDGPFLAWMHSPGLAGPAEQLGAFCRFRTALPMLETEMLILVVAAHHRCSGEWQIHAPIALSAGLSQSVLDALIERREPQFEQPRLATLYAFASELLRTSRVSEARVSSVQQLLGVAGAVELVGVLGYYTLVAMTLNSFQMRFDDRPDPFADRP